MTRRLYACVCVCALATRAVFNVHNICYSIIHYVPQVDALSRRTRTRSNISQTKSTIKYFSRRARTLASIVPSHYTQTQTIAAAAANTHGHWPRPIFLRLSVACGMTLRPCTRILYLLVCLAKLYAYRHASRARRPAAAISHLQIVATLMNPSISPF